MSKSKSPTGTAEQTTKKPLGVPSPSVAKARAKLRTRQLRNPPSRETPSSLESSTISLCIRPYKEISTDRVWVYIHPTTTSVQEFTAGGHEERAYDFPDMAVTKLKGKFEESLGEIPWEERDNPELTQPEIHQYRFSTSFEKRVYFIAQRLHTRHNR